MLYEQKVKYMEYRESGAKVKGAGFVKMECWGESCNFLVQISGLPANCSGEKKVYLLGGKQEILLGEIVLEQGKGRLEMHEKTGVGSQQGGLEAANAEMVRIPIAPEKEVVGILRERSDVRRERTESKPVAGTGEDRGRNPRERSVQKEERLQEKEGLSEKPALQEKEDFQKKDEVQEQKDSQREITLQTGNFQKKGKFQEREDSQRKVTLQEPGDFQRKETIRVKEESQKQETPQKGGIPEEAALSKKEALPEKAVFQEKNSQEKELLQERAAIREEISREKETQPYTFQSSLLPNKWEQLKAIYPRMKPFGDHREYLRITPGDFVILKDKSYRLANNSFLLHGYFNYKHLILHSVEKKGEVSYFVGVPGNFYDKEKEVAILFGFESFECAQEPAREGDFGYYMMRVEL